MKEIREYIRTELRKIDGMLAEHETEMKFRELPALKAHNLYLLSFGEFSNNAESNNYFEDECPVELSLYRKIDKRIPATFDRSVDFAKAFICK